jgi:signal transduction histidine kinase
MGVENLLGGTTAESVDEKEDGKDLGSLDASIVADIVTKATEFAAAIDNSVNVELKKQRDLINEAILKLEEKVSELEGKRDDVESVLTYFEDGVDNIKSGLRELSELL